MKTTVRECPVMYLTPCWPYLFENMVRCLLTPHCIYSPNLYLLPKYVFPTNFEPSYFAMVKFWSLHIFRYILVEMKHSWSYLTDLVFSLQAYYYFSLSTRVPYFFHSNSPFLQTSHYKEVSPYHIGIITPTLLNWLCII